MDEQKAYLEGQAKWVKNCKLKKGDELVVLCTAAEGQNGWMADWNPLMNECVGRVVQYQGICKEPICGITCHSYGTNLKHYERQG